MWLSYYDLQKEFTVETSMIPTGVALPKDPDIAANAKMGRFLRQ